MSNLILTSTVLKAKKK